MDFVVISLTALLASMLTLFSGFGLGTLLMPVVALFFPIEIAVAITAIVHLSNNLFKISLLGRYADWTVVIRFGLPAIIFAFLGALLLTWLADLKPLFSYAIGEQIFNVFAVKLVVGLLILSFVFIELNKRVGKIELDKKYLPLGGMISGFFGGVSGHQGALRSMFLIKAGLSKEAFIGTGITLAVLVDFARLSIYGWSATIDHAGIDWSLVALATLFAFVGAYVGRSLMKKVTIRGVQIVVSILLVVVSLGLISGVI